MTVNFQPQITWPTNPHLQPLQSYDFKTPSGLSPTHVREPIIVDAARMMSLKREQGSGLATTHGLVVPDLKVRFANPTTQWKPVGRSGGPSAPAGPCQFQFAGGDVSLQLTLAIYLLNTVAPRADDEISRKIFSRVYEHELLHVWDNVDIVSQWITPKLRNDQLIARHLIRAEPYQYGRPTDNPTLVRQEFLRYIGDRVEEAIFNIYAGEANRREQKRDAPTEYKTLADKVQELQSSRTIPSSPGSVGR
jgi:hypothetical protein